MKKSASLAQTRFIPRLAEDSQFENLIIKHYLLKVLIGYRSTTTDVQLVFTNPNAEAIEGVFIIPLSEKAGISDVEVAINDKIAPVKLANTKKLAAVFEKAFQGENDPVLQSIGASTLQTKVLQLPADAECRIEIRYTESVVPETDENFVYTHPLQSDETVENFEMAIATEAGYKFEKFSSASHDVTVTDEPEGQSHITYKTTAVKLDTDFVCSYLLTEAHLEEERLEAYDARLGVLRTPEPKDLITSSDVAPTHAKQAPMRQTRLSRSRGAISTREKMRAQYTITPCSMSFGSTPPNGAAYHDVYFKGHGTNPFIDTEDDCLSTFGMDADSASYAVTRRYLTDGHLPPTEAVRVEEFINAFEYNYAPPTDAAFAVHLEGAPSKFGKGKRLQLLRIGIQGQVIPDTDRKDAILTFVIDVSGSMARENRLGLVKRALRLLVSQLRPSDKIGIVVYGTTARVVLPHTGVVNRKHILEKIESLCPEGVTNVEDGIHKGYELAQQNSQQECINRVILCSDGVANEGVTSPPELLKEISDYADDKIFLTTVGFGMGNYNDTLMEQLAKKGNGNYAYVDTLKEAKRIFVENLTGTLQVIAKDAKIQVKFNEETVSRFRLLGYENREMKHEDFRNDEADAGEIGSGHSVTALYEVKRCKDVDTGELATVHIRHEDPDTGQVTEVSEKLLLEALKGKFEDASPDFQFAATVAQFAEILRESYWAKEGSLGAVQRTLKGILPKFDAQTPQREEQKKELLRLVRKARRLKDQAAMQSH